MSPKTALAAGWRRSGKLSSRTLPSRLRREISNGTGVDGDPRFERAGARRVEGSVLVLRRWSASAGLRRRANQLTVDSSDQLSRPMPDSRLAQSRRRNQ